MIVGALNSLHSSTIVSICSELARPVYWKVKCQSKSEAYDYFITNWI